MAQHHQNKRNNKVKVISSTSSTYLTNINQPNQRLTRDTNQPVGLPGRNPSAEHLEQCAAQSPALSAGLDGHIPINHIAPERLGVWFILVYEPIFVFERYIIFLRKCHSQFWTSFVENTSCHEQQGHAERQSCWGYCNKSNHQHHQQEHRQLEGMFFFPPWTDNPELKRTQALTMTLTESAHEVCHRLDRFGTKSTKNGLVTTLLTSHNMSQSLRESLSVKSESSTMC